uniref:TMPIT-like protein n=1 Tax=Araucaria cunninghamii TaxID=56994 RepID=A0A0D6R458_ARACU
MTNGVQNDHESRDMESIAEEIGRLVDQAKALQDSASAFCSKIKLEEEGIRLKALALESDIKRLRSSLNSASDKDAIDHREAEKLEEELFRARCMISEGDVSALLPAKSQGSFLKMFLGPINVRAIRNDVRLKVKEEYNNYRDRTAILFLLFPCVLLLLKNWVWNGCFPGFPVQLYQAWLLFFYTSLALRENILRVNGSDIRPWWVYHHYCAMFMALVSLTWEIRGQPSCVEKQQGVRLFLTWAIMQGVAMLLQNRYQRQRLYTRIALGKARRMDVVWGETSGVEGQLWLLYPILFILQGFEGYIGLLLLRTAIVGGNSEWQVVVCGILLLIMAVGNFANTVETLVTKSRVKARIKRSKSKQTMESMPLNFPSSRKEL